jgi:hydrogenase maturation protein HypF
VLAVGGHIKNTLALGWRDRAVISPHIGELHAPRSQRVFQQVIRDLQTLYRVEAESVVCDAHPGYVSTRWAKGCGLPVDEVYHHHAHASALAAEHEPDAHWMVFTWDGTGMGPDKSLWGGELLTGRPGIWRRAASLRPFHLPGGEMAGREPWRSAAALCWAAEIEWKACPEDASLAYQAWQRRLNCPKSSAAGRLFDAAAALIGILQKASYEGQGPMMLEAAAGGLPRARSLPLAEDETGLWLTDWQRLLPALLDEGRSVAQRAAEFHATMARVILDQARKIRARQSIDLVGLCGGVFQNRLLTEQALRLLEEDGFKVRLSETLPCNDAGLSYGQLIELGAAESAR